ncbi:galactosylgalactosylxylosylprotein 3-beta-glucuronosyltransferase 2 isoform X2 [Dermatophagoides farinae]|uniref:galactosylgalactosylxylosylprotein 3-beta-glucuronosyltransferase 2 isoform X2 n=1 Tax=Dermatophagoides farinae TaxID=6954 RepID=UPI001F11913D|nr:galactosylgalactosylxylosylprotein 3-beta-glucuronosyltransferase 2-like isoform X2 [Dermatophagoides farinae]
MWQMTSNQYQQLPNIRSQQQSSTTNISSTNNNSNSSSSSSSSSIKKSTWPLGIILTLPFIFFIILHNNPDGDLNSSSNDGEEEGMDMSNPSSKSSSSSSSSSWIEIRPPSLSSSSSSSSFQQSSDSKSNCICDMNSSSSNSQNHRMPFIPGEPVYDPERILIFLITPTYTRPTQAADMTRLSQTLQLVPDIFWIVVEDAHNRSRSVEDLLRRTNAPYAHLLGPRPPTHLDKRSGRGVSNRLRAFEWLRENYSNTTQKGVIYFADDDNAYDVRIFEEMRSTRIVSMFPVGLISTLGLSTPIVSRKSGKIIGFHDPFIGRRKFAVDMAGFAVNLQFFLNQKKATMPYKVGYEEDYFLKSLGVQIWQLEPKAQNCTQVLVWHTKTKPADQPKLTLMKKVTNYTETNLPDLYANQLEQL